MRLTRLVTIVSVLLPAAALFSTSVSFGGPSRGSVEGRPDSASAPAPGVSYREDVEPFLKANCGSCHSNEKHNGGFAVETPEAIFRGGSKYAQKAVVPGKASASAIVSYLRGKNQPRMPLNGPPVAEEQIVKIERWINQGAKIDPIRLGWPYTPVVAVQPPAVKKTSWAHNPIDNFILAKLEANGLTPASPASKVPLLRRVYADLTGIPPTPEETEAFVSDPSPAAFEKVIDRLLADPRYGERWGRHWLDLVRFAETHGFENDGIRPRAWRYRDYVIKSFNEDKPYDRFIKEQIAGDELYPGDPDAIIATGYARLAPWDELSREGEQRWQDYLNDVTDTTGSVMLGLTVGCARCHNHKYDRITQSDYYRLQAFFVQTKWVDARLPDVDGRRGSEDQSRLTALKQQLQDLRNKTRTAQKQSGGAALTDRDIDRILQKDNRDEYVLINNEIRRLTARVAPFEPVAEAINDGGRNAPVEHILLRGNLLTPGKEVQPGFLASLTGGEEKPADIAPPANMNSTGRRSALANWIGSAENPMTARVMVNRIWQHHFGRGLVGTPSDFGKNGDKATHPELLNWLAARFVQSGWSIKQMHKLMLMSAAYQQSTQVSSLASKSDPNNNLLSHMNRIRLEGEAIRDSILSVSGRLNPEMGGPSVYPKVSDEVLSTGSTHKWGASPADQGMRRTIYVFQRRSLVLPIVEVFDGADMTNTCPRRGNTTIAPQSLAMFNSEFTRTESRSFAERVEHEVGGDRDKQIDRAYLIALARYPTAAQKILAQQFIAKQVLLHSTNAGAKHTGAAVPNPAGAAEHAALAEFCHVLINTNEFIYLD